VILQITPYAIALILTGCVSLLLAGIAAQRRSAAGWIYFVLTMLAVTWWSLMYALELTVEALPLKLFWYQAGYAGALSIPPLWLLFAIQYHDRRNQHAKSLLPGLFIVPVVGILLAISNGYHQWVWTGFSLESSPAGDLLAATYGPVFWVNAVYAYALLLAGSVVLGRGVLRASRVIRRQTLTLIGAAAVPWISNLIFITGFSPIHGVDLTPPAFAVSGLLITSALFRYRLLEVMPVAYDVLFASMENEVLVLDAHDRLLEANPAARKLFGLSDSHIGQPVEIWLSRFPAFTCLFQEDNIDNCEFCLDLVSTQTWRNVQIVSLATSQQEHGGKLVTLNDITQSKLAEDKLNQAHHQALEASRMKTQLLASISHDLRSPLTSILGFADLLRNGVLGEINGQQRAALENIQESANQQIAFVNNLIGQAQLDTGQIVLNCTHFPVDDLISPIRTTGSFLASRKGIHLDFDLPQDLPKSLYGDPYWLRQVLWNLVNNANKFTSQGGITVRLYQDAPDQWSLQVKDTGIGMPKDKLEEIFEPFRQLGESRKSHGGSGLGLSIVRRLVERMGGAIQVESVLGQGSTFTISLPYDSAIQVPASELKDNISILP